MIYSFPTPKEIPHEIKQKVMNKVFPKKWSLIKRASLVKIFSVSLSFLGIFMLFSFLFIKNYFNLSSSNIILSEKKADSLEKISPKEVVYLDSSVYVQEKDVQEKYLEEVDLAILEAEDLLAELESLI